jgi:hypothetical protein
MTQPSVLTGQDIAEAQGAVTRVLELALGPTGISRLEYVLMRVLVMRGPYASAQELREYLTSQPQLGASGQAISALLADLQEKGLVSGTGAGDLGPAEATPAGAAKLAQINEGVNQMTRQLFAGLDASELATAHRVLRQLIGQAEDLVKRG